MKPMPPIAVLAGGVATRMMPMTQAVPKSMLLVAGEPFIAHQLRLFRREGIEHVVLCVGHLAGEIEQFVGDGQKFDLNVSYSYDGPTLLGTGGALRRAGPQLAPEFLVIYGDSYLDIPFRPVVEAFRTSNLCGLMTVLHNRGEWDTSNIEFCDGRIVNYSKYPTRQMAHIDFGLSVFRKQAMAAFESRDRFDLSEVYQFLISQGQLGGFEVPSRFYEIGSRIGLAETASYIAADNRKEKTS